MRKKEKNPSRGACVTLPRRFREGFCGSSSPFFVVLRSFFGLQPLYIGRRELTEVFAPSVDRLLADLVLLGRLGDRRTVCLAQYRDHLLFVESTLPHGLLAVEEPSSQELLVRRNRAGQAGFGVRVEARERDP